MWMEGHGACDTLNTDDWPKSITLISCLEQPLYGVVESYLSTDLFVVFSVHKCVQMWRYGMTVGWLIPAFIVLSSPLFVIAESSVASDCGLYISSFAVDKLISLYLCEHATDYLGIFGQEHAPACVTQLLLHRIGT